MPTSEATKKTFDLKAVGRASALTCCWRESRDEAVEMVLAMVAQLQAKNGELVLKADAAGAGACRTAERADGSGAALAHAGAPLGGATEEEDLAATEAEDKALDAERAELEETGHPVACHAEGGRRRICPGGSSARAPPRGTCVAVLRGADGEIGEDRERDRGAHSRPVPRRGASAGRSTRARGARRRCGRRRGRRSSIEKGLPGPGLLAHVAVSKYEQHLPLTRLVEIYGRGGLETSISTLCGWVEAVARDVRPIVERISEKALASAELQIDGSGLKVLDRDDPQGIRRGTMWCTWATAGMWFSGTPRMAAARKDLGGIWKGGEGTCRRMRPTSSIGSTTARRRRRRRWGVSRMRGDATTSWSIPTYGSPIR